MDDLLTEVPKAWQASTFVDFGQASPGQNVGPRWGGVRTADCAGIGFGAIRREVFCLWRPLEVVKPWQAP